MLLVVQFGGDGHDNSCMEDNRTKGCEVCFGTQKSEDAIIIGARSLILIDADNNACEAGF